MSRKSFSSAVLVIILCVVALGAGVGFRHVINQKLSHKPDNEAIQLRIVATSSGSEKDSLFNAEIRSTPGPTCLSGYTFNKIPDEELTEDIVIAVNEEYSVLDPEWKEHAQEVIDYVNNVLSQNTKKFYKVAKFLTYPTSEYPTLLNNSNYYISNVSYGGTSFFYYVYNQESEVPKIVSDTGLTNVASKTVIHERTFYSLWLVLSDSFSVLLGRSLLNQKIGHNQAYDGIMGLPLHELGHTLGLGYGEWYNYDFIDRTNTLPDLGRYSFRDMYPYDPMTSNQKSPYRFSYLNEALINLNANHQYAFDDIAKMYAPKVVVRVKDVDGNPVSDAVVKVFGAKKNAFYIKGSAQPLLQSLETDPEGIVEIENIDPNFQLNDSPTVGWLAKIIKVSKGEKKGGAVFTLVDSQVSCIIEKSQVHYIDIKI